MLLEVGLLKLPFFVHDGKREIDTYETLINPLLPIPFHIQVLTGISNEIVSDSPVFGVVADKIYAILEARVFVAHNVDFDYSFIKHHLEISGYSFLFQKLCSVRMSRKIKPGLKSYSLCNALRIPLNDKNRAGILRLRRYCIPVFNLQTEAVFLLRKLIHNFELYTELCSFNTMVKKGSMNFPLSEIRAEKSASAEYNLHVESALDHLANNLPSFVILYKGREENEQSCKVGIKRLLLWFRMFISIEKYTSLSLQKYTILSK